MLDVPPAPWFERNDGPSLAFQEEAAATAAEGPGTDYTEEEERIIAERLKKLGYLDD